MNKILKEMIKKSLRKNKLNENISGSKLIIVDIQRAYENSIHFDLEDFANDLVNFNGRTLYLYNGEDMGFGDFNEEVVFWLNEEADLDDESIDEIYNIHHIDKGYGFFRDVMDEGYDEDDIVEVVKYMIKTRNYDSRYIDEEGWEEINIDEDLKEALKKEILSLGMPSFDLKELKHFDNCTLIGGGEEECLKEIEILLQAMDISYNLYGKYIY